MSKKVHVLMPTYNSEHYIANAISSVMRQSYENAEIIVFNDGSTDGTQRVLDGFKNDCKQITFIQSQDNKGIAHGRSTLLKASQSKDDLAYILWLDSDDFYTDINFIKKFVDKMEETKADICFFNFKVQYESRDVENNAAGLKKDKNLSEKIMDKIAEFDNGICSVERYPEIMNFSSLGCIKGYKNASIIPHAKDEGLYEDFVYMAALLSVDKITSFPSDYRPLNFLRRSQSVTGQRTDAHFKQIISRLIEFRDFVVKNKPEYLKYASQFVKRKIEQYEVTIISLIDDQSYPDITEQTLWDFRNDSKLLNA